MKTVEGDHLNALKCLEKVKQNVVRTLSKSGKIRLFTSRSNLALRVPLCPGRR